MNGDWSVSKIHRGQSFSQKLSTNAKHLLRSPLYLLEIGLCFIISTHPIFHSNCLSQYGKKRDLTQPTESIVLSSVSTFCCSESSALKLDPIHDEISDASELRTERSLEGWRCEQFLCWSTALDLLFSENCRFKKKKFGKLTLVKWFLFIPAEAHRTMIAEPSHFSPSKYENYSMYGSTIEVLPSLCTSSTRPMTSLIICMIIVSSAFSHDTKGPLEMC